MAPFSIVPPGFFAANEALNVLPNVTLSQLISDAQKLIKKEIESIPKASYRCRPWPIIMTPTSFTDLSLMSKR
eukprot:1392643-Amorphochlora_amoeboformis.AAC.1